MRHELKLETNAASEIWYCSCERWQTHCALPQRDRNGEIVGSIQESGWRLNIIRDWRRHVVR